VIKENAKPPIEPAGCAVAIARVVDCRPMRRQDEAAALCSVYPGAYSWILANVRKIKHFPVRGQLGIFEVGIPGGIFD
jgi:hypothetical protein